MSIFNKTSTIAVICIVGFIALGVAINKAKKTETPAEKKKDGE
jgi:hypothetical protein